ncbi:MAG: PLP-dependent aminotransferase family protein [Magnetospirillum sp.]|nr:PLP-dependent aminotransferase family protein [Magnetospirillum sp.]
MSSWIPALEGRDGPRYLAIVDALAADIAAGRLGPGARLPTHRDLAWTLKLTVGTIARAYAEAERRGLVSGEVGRGTFIRAPGSAERTAIAQFLSPEMIGRGGVINMALNRPSFDQGAAVVAPALAALARRPDLAALMAYNLEPSFARHRVAAASWLAWEGLEVDPETIVIGVGSQQCLVAALAATTRPGDTVLVEDFTYPGIKSSAALLGREIAPVATDDGGLIPEEFERALQTGRGRVLYTIATVHNPLNATLSAERRAAVAAIARRHDALIIEDAIHRFLAPEAPPAIATLAPERVLYITAMAKSVSPGLRIGFMAVPPALKPRADAAVGATTLTLATPLVEVAAMIIDDGTAFAQAERQRAEALARVELAAQILGEAVRPPTASFNVWLPLAPPWRSPAFVAAAGRAGVALAPTESFAVGRPHRDGVRVSVTPPADRDELRRGLAVLAGLLDSGPELGVTV